MRPTQLTAKIRLAALTLASRLTFTILDAKNIDYPLYFFATNLTPSGLQGWKTGRRSEELSRLSKNESYFSEDFLSGDREFSLYQRNFSLPFCWVCYNNYCEANLTYPLQSLRVIRPERKSMAKYENSYYSSNIEEES